jgi:hypothetical protein
MDTARFDDLTRTLADGLNRRRFLAGLGALAAGLLGIEATAAATTCPPGQVLAAGKRCLCKRTGRPPVHGACPCPAGLTDTGDGLGCVECHADADCPEQRTGKVEVCRSGSCVRWCDTIGCGDCRNCGMTTDGPLCFDVGVISCQVPCTSSADCGGDPCFTTEFDQGNTDCVPAGESRCGAILACTP